jgi:hypothetical protein
MTCSGSPIESPRTPCQRYPFLWMSLSPRLPEAWSAWRSPFHNFRVIVIGTLTILLVGLVVSQFRFGVSRAG